MLFFFTKFEFNFELKFEKWRD